MKPSKRITSLFGLLASAVFGMSAIFPLLEGCRPREIPPPSKTGAISVNLGLGAGSDVPYDCGRSSGGTVTIVSASGQPYSQVYSFSGFSDKTSPACQTSLLFGNLQPGLYTIRDSYGANCQKQVTAGQSITCYIRTDTGTCQ